MILTRARLISAERFDLEDFLADQSGVRTDSKFWTKQFISAQNYILKGFKVTGIGLTSATVEMANGTLVHGQNTYDFSWYTAEESPTNIIIPDASLQDGIKNYVELYLAEELNTPVVKAFWDPAANGGLGSEFNQEIDTVVDLRIAVDVRVGGFSGDPNRIPLAIIETNPSGNIIGILDKRNLLFRLGKPNNIDYSFTWTSQEEPSTNLVLNSVSGTFIAGETVNFTSGASGVVTIGGTSNISVNLLSSDGLALGDSISGSSSFATGNLSSYEESFVGADKDVSDLRKLFEALTTEIASMKGKRFWYQQQTGTIHGLFDFLNSVITPNSSSARFFWNGSSLSITDDNVSPNNNDILAYIRIFGRANNLSLTRQDAQGGSVVLSIANDQVLYVELPDLYANRTFSGQGIAATNYKTVSRASYVQGDNTYWLAYREGTRLIVRGLGELEAGEGRQISDETPVALQQFLGFDPETAISVPYSHLPSGLAGYNYTNSDTLVEAISTNTANINDVLTVLDTNVYREEINIVAAAPTGNDLIGPIASGTNITLPLDSRNGNAVREYIVGDGLLKVFLNGQHLDESVGSDTGAWEAVGLSGSSSSTIKILIDLEVFDHLLLVMDSLGGFFSDGSSSGSGDLQDAYNNGRTIVVSSGQPIEISGPASQKLLRVLGDLEVTGTIDPIALEYTPQLSNPISLGDTGNYVNSIGELIFVKPDGTSQNLSQIAAGNTAAEAIEDTFYNDTGSTLQKSWAVRINILGDLSLIDVSDESQVDAIVGLVKSNILDQSSGAIISTGRIENYITAEDFGTPLYINKTGLLTSTKPNIGVDGFLAGDFVVKVGVIARNKNNPANKDLLVNISIIGKL